MYLVTIKEMKITTTIHHYNNNISITVVVVINVLAKNIKA